jgi:hypothetical protein
MRPGAALAGTRDIKAEIRDIPGNTGLLATLRPGEIAKSFSLFLTTNANFL